MGKVNRDLKRMAKNWIRIDFRDVEKTHSMDAFKFRDKLISWLLLTDWASVSLALKPNVSYAIACFGQNKLWYKWTKIYFQTNIRLDEMLSQRSSSERTENKKLYLSDKFIVVQAWIAPTANCFSGNKIKRTLNSEHSLGMASFVISPISVHFLSVRWFIVVCVTTAHLWDQDSWTAFPK